MNWMCFLWVYGIFVATSAIIFHFEFVSSPTMKRMTKNGLAAKKKSYGKRTIFFSPKHRTKRKSSFWAHTHAHHHHHRWSDARRWSERTNEWVTRVYANICNGNRRIKSLNSYHIIPYHTILCVMRNTHNVKKSEKKIYYTVYLSHLFIYMNYALQANWRKTFIFAWFVHNERYVRNLASKERQNEA